MTNTTDDDPSHHPYEDPLSSTKRTPHSPSDLERAVRSENKRRSMADQWDETPADRLSMKVWTYGGGTALLGYVAAKTYENIGVDLFTVSSTIMTYLNR